MTNRRSFLKAAISTRLYHACWTSSSVLSHRYSQISSENATDFRSATFLFDGCRHDGGDARSTPSTMTVVGDVGGAAGTKQHKGGQRSASGTFDAEVNRKRAAIIMSPKLGSTAAAAQLTPRRGKARGAQVLILLSRQGQGEITQRRADLYPTSRQQMREGGAGVEGGEVSPPHWSIDTALDKF
jgi:hypothetical protein